MERQSPNPVGTEFLTCLDHAHHETSPFYYWLLDDPLPAGDCEAIANLPFPPPEAAIFDGKRDTNNEQWIYFTHANQARFPGCRRVVEGFQSAPVRQAIQAATGADLSEGHLRIEYCRDPEGFWLEPHTDIFVQKFTMLVYLSDDPALADAGTNIFEGPPGHKFVSAAPYGRNKGVIFIPAENTWHGFGQHPLRAVRKSIIINYVTSDWRDTWELV